MQSYLKKLSLVSLLLIMTSTVSAKSIILVGYDEKMDWDSQGKTQFLADEGKDMVSLFDVETDPKIPKFIKSISLKNSIAGPPANMVIAPDKQLAFIANSLDWVQKEGKWQSIPGNKLSVIDLSDKKAVINTIEVNKQPSGLDINPDESLLLVTSNFDTKISVVKVSDHLVKLIDSIEVGKKTAAVAFTPDGKRAFFVSKDDNKVGILNIEENKVTYNSDQDINVGISPYNIKISPKGGIALVNNIGITGGNDGNVDSMSVIDIDAKHPHVIDSIAVGDGPEGLAISPKGDMAVSVIINGSQNAHGDPKTKWAYHPNGKVAILKIDGKKVQKTQEFDVGGMPEGVAFDPSGKYFYVGNFKTRDMSIFEVVGSRVKKIKHALKLDGAPASMVSSKK